MPLSNASSDLIKCGQSEIFFRQRRRFDWPLDAYLRIIPNQPTLVFREVEIRAFVLKVCSLREHAEAMSVPWRYPQLAMVISTEFYTNIGAKRLRIGVNINSDVKDRTRRAAYQLTLRPCLLVDASRAALRPGSANGCPAQKTNRSLLPGSAQSGNVSLKKPRSSPKTLGSIMSTFGRFVSITFTVLVRLQYPAQILPIASGTQRISLCLQAFSRKPAVPETESNTRPLGLAGARWFAQTALPP